MADDRIRQYKREWYLRRKAQDPDGVRRKNRINSARWRKANPQKVSAAVARRKEKADAYMREYYKRPDAVEKRRARNRRWYLNNKEKAYAFCKSWRVRNPIRAAGYGVSRRARKYAKSIKPALVNRFVQQVRSSEAVRCYYCGKRISGKRAHIDHVFALSTTGHHEIGNVCTACPKCNLTKNAKPLTIWAPGNQPLLPL